ncbi:MAG: hypothetical protein AB1Z98_27805 [Nannocystaceae bacterium]
MGPKSVLEQVADFITPVSATPSLDVAANREHLRSGDPQRIRDGLRFLAELGAAARPARPDIEAMLHHDDPELAALAREVLEGLPT